MRGMVKTRTGQMLVMPCEQPKFGVEDRLECRTDETPASDGQWFSL